MTQRLNYIIETGPGILREQDLATCGHCQMQMAVQPPKDGHVIARVLPGCHGCGKFVCNVCKAQGGCDVWEKKMERSEKRYALLKSLGLEK